jgi:ABC-type sugar transport system substrate-binding protein
MANLKFLLSLTTSENDYQLEQANAATLSAKNLGVELQTVYAENDAINQSTQILKAIQVAPGDCPNAIVFEPVGGTALPQVARAAVHAGIGWVVLNRDANYIPELREGARVPVFGLSSDHAEIGRIQGRQAFALLPHGGSALYIQGPSENSAARDRLLGFQEVKHANLHLTMLKGQWTEESAQRTIRSWLKLTTSQKTAVDLVAAQNDLMAVGARKAFQEVTSEVDRERWLNLPFLGCDGLSQTGQSWVRSGLLAATIFVPPNAGQALEMVCDAIRKKKMPEELVLTVPQSIPPLTALHPRK